MEKLSWMCRLTPDCENPRLGNLEGCASCESALRRLAKDLNKVPKTRKNIAKQSEKRKGENTIYAAQIRTWIVGKRCACCGDPATECHHMKGRTNELLLEKKYWLPVCRGCHRLITEDSAWAIKEGYSLMRSN